MKQLTYNSYSFILGVIFKVFSIGLSIFLCWLGKFHFTVRSLHSNDYLDTILIIFLGIEFIVYSIMQYQQRLYGTFWVKVWVGERFFLKIIVFAIALLAIFAQFFALSFLINPEKIDWISILIVFFIFNSGQEKFAKWVASIRFTNKLDYPNYKYF